MMVRTQGFQRQSDRIWVSRDAWNLPSEGTGVGGSDQPEGSGAFAPDHGTVRTTTTTPPHHITHTHTPHTTHTTPHTHHTTPHHTTPLKRSTTTTHCSFSPNNQCSSDTLQRESDTSHQAQAHLVQSGTTLALHHVVFRYNIGLLVHDHRRQLLRITVA